VQTIANTTQQLMRCLEKFNLLEVNLWISC
jgi:hypothetical protein